MYHLLRNEKLEEREVRNFRLTMAPTVQCFAQ